MSRCAIATEAINEALSELSARPKADLLALAAAYAPTRQRRAKRAPRSGTLLLRGHRAGVALDPDDVVEQDLRRLTLAHRAGEFFQNNAAGQEATTA